MTYVLGPCPEPGCPKRHGVISTRRSKPAPYRGPFVRAQRSAPDSPQTLTGALELDPPAPAAADRLPPVGRSR